MKPTLFILAVAALLASQPAVAAVAAEAASRPNILFIMTDDQAPWALGASGHPHAWTPNLDRLVREGAYLKNAFCVTPVCSPSRASLLTSRYGSELGITDWINAQKEPGLGLDPATTTWPELLQKGGYSTGLIGKWHVGDEPEQHPTKNGYGYFMGFTGGGTSPKDPTLEVDGQKKKLSGFTYDILTDGAMKFIRDHDRDKPFALSLHYRAPHTAWLPQPEADLAPFAGLDPTIPNPEYPKLDVQRVKKMTVDYLGSVHGVDRNVGRVLDLLDELKLADSTLIVYTSDHGYNMGHNGIWHKGNGHWVLTEPPPATENIPKNQRPNMYDNSLKVPTIVRWPGTVKPGTVVTHTVTHLDWFPTLCAAAGVEVPKDLTIRGRSILPLLKGESPSDWNDVLFAQYSTHHQSRTQMRAIRTDRWKLVRDYRNTDRDELYDLQADPAEAKNLIDDPSSEVRKAIQELDAILQRHLKQVNDPVLAKRQ